MAYDCGPNALEHTPPVRTLFLVVLLAWIGACSAPRQSLEGAWTGEDNTGARITMTFGPDRAFSVAGADGQSVVLDNGRGRMEFDVLTEVDPDQLYLRFFQGDSLLAKVPFGIYKIESNRLVVCNVATRQSTIAGTLPVGDPTYEWPKTFSGDCYALDRA